MASSTIGISPEKAIEGFVSLAKSTKGKATASCLREALSHPSTFVFAELLDVPSVKELGNSSEPICKQSFELLRIFAYGTYSDFVANKSELGDVTEKMIYKLRKLTVVSLSANLRVLPYKVLQEQLAMENVRELEDLLIDSMYQGIIRGKLDQKLKCIEIFEAIGRDIRPGQLDSMRALIQQWMKETEKTLVSLEQNSQRAIESFEVNKKHNEEFEEKIENMKKTIKASMEAAEEGGGRAGGVAGMMGLGPMAMMMGAGAGDFDADYSGFGDDDRKRGRRRQNRN